MFNLFFRPYVPGFRVGPDRVPGFDIDDNGLPRRAIASFDGTLPNSASQQYPDAEQYPDAAPTQTSPSVSFGLPGAASWVLPTPLPGFRVSPQGDVPGFNVGPQHGAPGFNVDENGDQQQQTIWSDELPPGSATPQDPNTTQTPIPPPDVDDSVPPAPPSLPDWPYQRVPLTLPRLPTEFDPRTGPRLEIIPPPRIGLMTVPGETPWSPSIAPQPLPGGDIRARGATTQNINSQPAAQQAIPTAWLRRPNGGWPYAQGEGALSPIPLVRPPADSNFSLANTGNGGEQKAQEMLVPPYQQTQPKMPSALLDTGLPTSPELETQNLKMAGFEPRSDQEFSQLIEAYRQPKETEGRQPSAGRPPPPPPPNQNGVSSSVPGDDGSSLGQRLVQSSIDTLVPGAHYQGLAGQQLRAGNYLGAGVYQAAALADAVLGMATFGLGPKLTAAGRVAAAEGVSLFRRVFNSERQLKDFLGKVPKGMHWHHIVEKNKAVQFGQQRIQSIENIVALPEKEHNQLSGFYASKQPYSEGMRVRDWLRGQSFEEQYEFGMKQLKRVLGY